MTDEQDKRYRRLYEKYARSRRRRLADKEITLAALKDRLPKAEIKQILRQGSTMRDLKLKLGTEEYAVAEDEYTTRLIHAAQKEMNSEVQL